MFRIYFLIISFLIFVASIGQDDFDFTVQTGHATGVNQVEFSHSGKVFATAGYDNNVILWDLASGKQIKSFSTHTDKITDVSFTENDQYIVTASEDSTIQIWDVKESKRVSRIKSDFIPTSAVFTPENKLVYYTARSAFTAYHKQKQGTTLYAPKKGVYTTVRIAPNDNGLILGSSVKAESKLKSEKDSVVPVKIAIEDVDFNLSGDRMAVLTKKRNVLIYRYVNGKYEYSYTLLNSYGSYSSPSSISLGDSVLATIGDDNTVSTYNINSGKIIHHYKGHYLLGRDVSVHPDDDVLVSCGDDGNILLWDIHSGDLVREFVSTGASINFANFLEDNITLTIGYNDGIIKLWNLNQGGQILNHQFKLLPFQKRKGWKYHVLQLKNQSENLLTYEVVLSKPYKNSYYFEECRFYDFKWNLKTNEKSLVETFVKNYRENKCSVDDLIVRENKSVTRENAFVIAEDTHFSVFLDGSSLENKYLTEHTNAIKSVDYNKDKELYVTAGWDGKILLYNKQKEKVAKLVAIGNDDFIIVVDSNYYYATKGALQYVGYTSGLEVESFHKYDLYYNRPDKVYQKFPFGTPEVVENFKLLYEKRKRRVNLDRDVMFTAEEPEIDLQLLSSQTVKDNFTEISIKAKDNEGLTKLHFTVDGVPMLAVNGLEITGTEIEKKFQVNLQYGVNRIEAWVENEALIKSKKAVVLVKSTDNSNKPELYFVGIGVSHYHDTVHNLKYANKDIADVYKLFKRKNNVTKGFYSLLLEDEQFVKDSLSRINDFLADAGVEDLVILYYAGHGVLNKNLDYFLASYDNDFNNPSLKGVAYDSLENIMVNCESRKKLLFLDACHSGELDHEELKVEDENVIIGEDIIFRGNNNLSQGNSLSSLKMLFADLKVNNGVTVISSAGGADYAVESDEWENGAFTHCLMKGIKKNKADVDENGSITIQDLLQYLQEEVPKVTNGYQQPTFRSENIENDFVLWRK